LNFKKSTYFKGYTTKLLKMKKNLFVLLVCISITSYAQTFPVGHMSINFKDATRNGGYSISGGIAMSGTGRNIGTEVYYPALSAGNNTAVAAGQFPIVVFGHGFAMTYDNYDNIYNRLAALGYIVLLPRTEGSIFPNPNHADFGADLKLLATQGLLLNSATTPTALATFNGKVIQKSAIGGHSMGAGCSYIAAQNNSTLTCLFNFAAATSNTTGVSSVAGANLVTVPTLVISGEKDNVADSAVQNSHYNPTASNIKFHSIIKDVTHCDFGNGMSVTCTIGQAACNTPSCNAIYFNRYMSYLEPFLANQLKSDCSAGNTFMSLIQNPSTDRVGQKITGSIACTATGIINESLVNALAVFPNPTNEKINITYHTEIASAVVFELYDISGRLILKSSTNIGKSNSGATVLNIEHIENGSYILYIRQNEFKTAYKIIKH
jgi:dienelactone hydrolase